MTPEEIELLGVHPGAIPRATHGNRAASEIYRCRNLPEPRFLKYFAPARRRSGVGRPLNCLCFRIEGFCQGILTLSGQLANLAGLNVKKI